jgi:hypothetical protein
MLKTHSATSMETDAAHSDAELDIEFVASSEDFAFELPGILDVTSFPFDLPAILDVVCSEEELLKGWLPVGF